MPTKPKKERYEIDPDDGLPRELVGEWVAEKHLRLQHYIDISRAARRKFNGNSTFIDLYCGTGRARIPDSNQVHDGSALVAGLEAAKHDPFGKMYIADLDELNVSACATRLERSGLGNFENFIGPAEETVSIITSKLNKSGLHFAFLDPYNLMTLPFSVIRTLANFPRMDLLIHFSMMDLQRNVSFFMRSGRLDHFAPGWRNHVDQNARNNVKVQAVFQYWCNLISELGYKDPTYQAELVKGTRNQPLYRLVLASKSDIGKRFWGEVSNVTAQTRLPF
ncbi:MAG: three-Cys-motif partner protein TcmP [Proteobacteria bacterium]|nr:three-Cys-motif partner protein TcmP [Pseudomonadota bacterium]